MAAFARDVLVNVVANLIAAAVIYLVGAMLGIFPAYWRLLIPIAGIFSYVAMIYGYSALRDRRRVLAAGLLVGGTVVQLASSALYLIVYSGVGPPDPIAQALALIFTAINAAGVCVLLVLARQSVRGQ